MGVIGPDWPPACFQDCRTLSRRHIGTAAGVHSRAAPMAGGLEKVASTLMLHRHFFPRFGKKRCQFKARWRTLSPLVEVRILVPQPIDLAKLFTFHG